ncbi:hypothetical protein QWY99_05980 [Flavobacterium branchiarum]|nr:hypothetical protein [Flavobacterium branchiarum]MDN3671522.1 hypothetical protein [Flavobacterium branchiarum]MDN3672601.1 hypothetical protein [Flavobacterium branchiarum]
MLGSYSHFFKQDSNALRKRRKAVSQLLKLKGYSFCEINIYIIAYDFFCSNPSEFDGATVVKDLCDIPGLDLDAMLHDYHYLRYRVGSSFTLKWKADWAYAKGQERKGKGQYSAFSRFVGLTIIGLVFVPYTRVKRGKLSRNQKKEFLKEYQILIK